MRTSDRRKVRQKAHQLFRKAVSIQHDLLTVHRVPHNQLVPGTVVWAHIPYQEIDTEKLRPALVVGFDGSRVTLRPITSAESRRRLDGYIELEHPAAAGLDRPCAVSLRRTVELDPIELVSRAGELSLFDFLAVEIGTVLLPVLNPRFRGPEPGT